MASETATVGVNNILACCPFSFVVDGAGRLSGLGKYFVKMHPEIAGLRFSEAFRILGREGASHAFLANPAGAIGSAAIARERVELQVREEGGLHIVGTFLPFLREQDGVIFVGTVSPRDIAAVIDHGLTMSDFGPFDTSADYAMMAHVNEAVLTDTRILNERLAAARDEAVVARRKIEAIALVDALSGLGNRTAFQQVLADCTAEAIAHPDKQCSLLLIDIDAFKPINDHYGHAIGDMLIKSIGERINSTIDGSAVAFRIGGDEFAVLFSFVEPQEARRRAEQLLRVVRAPHVIQEKSIPVDVSGGMAGRQAAINDGESLYKAADIALYAAKRAAGRKLRVFNAAMGRRELNKKLLERDLVEAIERQELQVAVQPLFDLRTGALWGGEALARWWNPRLQRYVPPNQFIRIAEEFRLVAEIDLFVLETMLQAQRAFCDGTRQLSWSTNLSALTLEMKDLLPRIGELLQRYGPPRCPIELEITESAIFPNGAATSDVLKSMREMKLGVAIDDFGAGQTSVSHLTQVPITRLKLDRSLLEEIDTNARAEKIVRSIVALAHELGLRVTAEGIERTTQVDKLRRMGATLVQGYLYARPMPLADYIAFVQRETDSQPGPRAVAG